MKFKEINNALGAFAVLDPTHFNLHFAQVFLYVAEHNFATFQEIESALDLSNSAVSRTAMAMGKENRKGKSGFDLLYVFRDPMEGRRYKIGLTSKGKAFLRTLNIK